MPLKQNTNTVNWILTTRLSLPHCSWCCSLHYYAKNTLHHGQGTFKAHPNQRPFVWMDLIYLGCSSPALLCIHPVFMYNVPVQWTSRRQKTFTSGHISLGTEKNSDACVDLPYRTRENPKESHFTMEKRLINMFRKGQRMMVFIKADGLTVASWCTTLIRDHCQQNSPGKEERQLVRPDAGSQVAHSQEMLLMAAASLKLPDGVSLQDFPCWMSSAAKISSKAVIPPALPLCLCITCAPEGPHGDPLARSHPTLHRGPWGSPSAGHCSASAWVCCVLPRPVAVALVSKKQQTLPYPCPIFILDFMRKSNCLSLISQTN